MRVIARTCVAMGRAVCWHLSDDLCVEIRLKADVFMRLGWVKIKLFSRRDDDDYATTIDIIAWAKQRVCVVSRVFCEQSVALFAFRLKYEVGAVSFWLGLGRRQEPSITRTTKLRAYHRHLFILLKGATLDAHPRKKPHRMGLIWMTIDNSFAQIARSDTHRSRARPHFHLFIVRKIVWHHPERAFEWFGCWCGCVLLIYDRVRWHVPGNASSSSAPNKGHTSLV